MIGQARLERMRHVLEQRIGWVRCALEAVHHRHNVSAALRTCDAMGLHRVHLVEGHFTPARGVARGAERWLDIAWHASAGEALSALREAGCAVYVADLAEDGLAPEEIPLDRPVCLWFGAELAGVSEEARSAADGVMTIPMRGFAQSLNVSVATALAVRAVAERARSELGERALLSEAEKQRTWDRWIEQQEHMAQGAARRAALRFDGG